MYLFVAGFLDVKFFSSWAETNRIDNNQYDDLSLQKEKNTG